MESSRHISCFFMTLLVICSFIVSCNAQKTFGTQYLKLEKVIPLSGVKGRIDHLAINLKSQIAYMSALGNNTLEVIDLEKGKVIHSITGLSEPQGAAYIPQYDEILVCNGGNGECYFYDAHTYRKTATLRLSSDADDVRYDSTHEKIYVAYGEGGIAVIDAATKGQTGNIKLSAHPEGFQAESKTGKIFVNVPDVHKIAMINPNDGDKVAYWEMEAASANFPMAADWENNRLFIVCRRPDRLIVLDNSNGKVLLEEKCIGDADDVYYDSVSKRVYVSGGEGYINIFQDEGNNHFKQIANIATRSGARTSLLVPQLHLFLLAERASEGKEARLLVYQLR